MVLTSGQKTLARFASFIGILQGVAAFVVSLICIVLYANGIVTNAPTNYFDEYSLALYNVFLKKSYTTINDDILIIPPVFNIFMWIYLGLSTIWIISSIFLSIAVQVNQKTRVSRASKFWLLIACLISILDLILTIFLGNDFETCLINSTLFDDSAVKTQTIDESLCYNIWLPVMTFAARGYVLWFVNLIFAYFLYKNQKSSFGDVNHPLENPIPPIPRPVINVQPPVNPNFVPNDWNDQRDNRSPPQSPNFSYPNRWPNQWTIGDDLRMVEDPVYRVQSEWNQSRHLY